MARPTSFNKATIIEDSMIVFWQKGFQGTSMRDIGKATKLNPGSIYGSFGNKRKLFLLVLEQYYKQLTASINKALHSKAKNVDVLNEFFHLVVKDNERTDVKGCLLVNCLLELADDREMQAHISAMFSGFEEMFYWVIISGQKSGNYNPRLNARTMAQYLVNNYFGLRVQCMTEKDSNQLSTVISSFLTVLD